MRITNHTALVMYAAMAKTTYRNRNVSIPTLGAFHVAVTRALTSADKCVTAPCVNVQG